MCRRKKLSGLVPLSYSGEIGKVGSNTMDQSTCIAMVPECNGKSTVPRSSGGNSGFCLVSVCHDVATRKKEGPTLQLFMGYPLRKWFLCRIYTGVSYQRLPVWSKSKFGWCLWWSSLTDDGDTGIDWNDCTTNCVKRPRCDDSFSETRGSDTKKSCFNNAQWRFTWMCNIDTNLRATSCYCLEKGRLSCSISGIRRICRICPS